MPTDLDTAVATRKRLMSSDLQSDAHTESLAGMADGKRHTIAPSSGLGHNAFVFDEDEVVHLLRDAVDREGSQIAFADHYGVDRANVSAVLNGRRRINGSLVKALGFRGWVGLGLSWLN